MDECVSERLADMVGIFDRSNEIRPHHLHFEKGTPDEKWIPEVAAWKPKPVCIMGDGRVFRHPVLRGIAKESAMSFVVLGDSFTNLAWEDMAWKFIKVWPDIVKAVDKVHQATIFDVKVSALKVQARYATADIQLKR